MAIMRVTLWVVLEVLLSNWTLSLPTMNPSFSPSSPPIVTSGFLQMATYTNSPCIDSPSSWSVKQLGVCSCSIFNCQMYSAQSYGSGMKFILSTYNGYGDGDSYRPSTNCTGTPVISSQSLNTSTTCVQANDYYSSSTTTFLVAIYTKNLMQNQNNMGGVIEYNSLYGCQNNVLNNVIGEDFNMFGICSLDPSTNNWMKTTCPKTTGTINSVSGGFERLNYYSNSSCKLSYNLFHLVYIIFLQHLISQPF